jgi:4-amino-4-deoxy-L-arabinose transferase-like glycosyltransferase
VAASETIFRHWSSPAWTGLWVVLMGVALATRPLLPVDETRYLAVAWEMWNTGDLLVPHLNGEPYSHKPPLLFWLINLGWAVFGVNEWWPRLVAPLFGLANLFLTAGLARRLWPEETGYARAAPLILVGGLFWALFTTLTMFDMIVAFCTLLGLGGVVRAWRTGAWTGFAVLGVAIGLGVLAKGPAVLVHVLPVALLAPLWGRRLNPAPWADAWRRWYGGVVAALAGGAAMGLAWAIPAAEAGGEAYADAILWGQTAGRMVSSFAHERAWWWYLPLLPLMVLPWVAWPALWRGLRARRPAAGNGGVRFCLCWFLPALAVFSMISGKQLHYLLPEIPALALLIAFISGRPRETPGAPRRDQAVPGLLFAVLGLGALAVPIVAPPDARAALGYQAAWGWGAVLAAAGLAVAVARMDAARHLAALAGLGAVAVITFHLMARPVVSVAFDLTPTAARLAEWERQGVPLAHFGTYHGQFQFLGRLRKPLAVIGLLHPDVETWLERNPDGKVVSYHRVLPDAAKPLFTYPFRRGLVVIWDAATMIAHPGIADRKS